MERQDLDPAEGAVTDFFRIDANVLQDGRILDAAEALEGRSADAILAVFALWCQNRVAGQTGTVELRHAKRMLVPFGVDHVRFAAACNALESAGYIKINGTKATIVDWGEFWYCGLSDAERKINQRARDAAKGGVTGGAVTGAVTHVTGGAVTSDSQTDNQYVPPSPRAGARESGAAGGGGSEPQQPLIASLARHGVFSGSAARRAALATELAARGINEFDVDDLASVAAKKGLDNPSGWLANVLQDDATTSAELGRLRQPVPLYDETGGSLRSDDARGEPIKPEDVGIVWCEVCRGTAFGKHWEDHGPVGWRKGDKAPEGWVPPQPAPIPSAKQFKATMKKLADQARKEAQ